MPGSLGTGWEDSVKVRFQSSIFALSRLKTALGSSAAPARPCRGLRQGARGRTGAGSWVSSHRLHCSTTYSPGINSSSTPWWLSGHQTAAGATASSLCTANGLAAGKGCRAWLCLARTENTDVPPAKGDTCPEPSTDV